MKQVLFAWIGTTDLQAAGIREIKGAREPKQGPIAQALAGLSVDTLVLLNNSPKEEGAAYEKWIKQKYSGEVIVRQADFSDPRDYEAVYEHCISVLQDFQKNMKEECGVTFHLSPGTPTMCAIWVLLAKSIFPADMIQTSDKKDGVDKVHIPFDIAAEYVSPMMKKEDAEFENISKRFFPDSPDFHNIIFRSRQMKEVIIMAYRIAPLSFPVLIEGESGTGKELMARAIHNESSRSGHSFVAVNCGAIPENLIESELFGHQIGAFTGATKVRKGKIMESSGGTLFLDEIGELPLKSQVMLLRVLQEKKVCPVGGDKEMPADLRVIAATNRTLQEEVLKGNFREDLFYRLAAGYVYLPPIREREGDIGILIDHFLNRINEKEGKKDEKYLYKKFSPAAKNILLQHSWPGNVRELDFTIQRAALLYSGTSRIEPEDVGKAMLPVFSKENSDVLNRPLGGDFSIEKLCNEIKIHYIKKAMEQAKDRIREASDLLGIKNYQTLKNWIKKLSDG